MPLGFSLLALTQSLSVATLLFPTMRVHTKYWSRERSSQLGYICSVPFPVLSASSYDLHLFLDSISQNHVTGTYALILNVCLDCSAPNSVLTALFFWVIGCTVMSDHGTYLQTSVRYQLFETIRFKLWWHDQAPTYSEVWKDCWVLEAFLFYNTALMSGAHLTCNFSESILF